MTAPITPEERQEVIDAAVQEGNTETHFVGVQVADYSITIAVPHRMSPKTAHSVARVLMNAADLGEGWVDRGVRSWVPKFRRGTLLVIGGPTHSSSEFYDAFHTAATRKDDRVSEVEDDGPEVGCPW